MSEDELVAGFAKTEIIVKFFERASNKSRTEYIEVMSPNFKKYILSIQYGN